MITYFRPRRRSARGYLYAIAGGVWTACLFIEVGRPDRPELLGYVGLGIFCTVGLWLFFDAVSKGKR